MMLKHPFLFAASLTVGLAGISYASTSLQVTNGFVGSDDQVSVDHRQVVSGGTEMTFLNYGGGASVADVCTTNGSCKHFVVVDAHEPCGTSGSVPPADDVVEPAPEDPAAVVAPAPEGDVVEPAPEDPAAVVEPVVTEEPVTDPVVTHDPFAPEDPTHNIEPAAAHREHATVSGWHLNFYADGMYVGDVCVAAHDGSVAHAQLHFSNLGEHDGSHLAVLSEAGSSNNGLVFAW